MTLAPWILLAAFAGARNVVVLLADDAGLELAAYGNSAVLTPELDALAKRSTVFDRAYTTVSSCAPSRASILTGLPSHQHGAYGVPTPPAHEGVVSISNLLQKHGVLTTLFGKYGLEPDFTSNSFRVFDFDWGLQPNSPRCCGSSKACRVGVSSYFYSRNITQIKGCARDFFSDVNALGTPFFMLVGFGDPHRAGQGADWGENWGNDGSMPDWTPWVPSPEHVVVPNFLHDSETVRAELTKQYTILNRMDQGIGLVLAELKAAGLADDTLIVYTSDNGPPFTGAKANAFEAGMHMPLIVYDPLLSTQVPHFKGPVTSLDLFPTILDYFGIAFEPYRLNGIDVQLTGKSLLPLLKPASAAVEHHEFLFASHQAHEPTSYYPVRTVWHEGAQTGLFKLNFNIVHKADFPTPDDVYFSPSHQELLLNTSLWHRELESEYFQRPRLELYNVTADPLELSNLADSTDATIIELRQILIEALKEWQVATNDPWYERWERRS
eukprot:TRINITY_DN12486_c0_g1_i1.p1 TRINITY_DN12486_c0_g1~~TRINITY_DN12486_c0_g1_i1.p1  ORF type:complete len:506 (-),score=86.51 TRINITY_DN12486_c0_g1_i1:79-1563(-)